MPDSSDKKAKKPPIKRKMCEKCKIHPAMMNRKVCALCK